VPVRRSQQDRSLATQGRLLEATIAVLVECGYVGTSTTEICRAAGVSRGAQLHHYPTKAQLVAAAVEHLFATRHEAFRRRMEDVGRGRDRIDAAFEGLWAIYSGPTLYAWMELVVAARTDAALREHVAAVDRRFFAQARETFARLFGDALPEPQASAATRLVTSVFDGLALHFVIERDPAVIEGVLEVFKQLVRSFLK
jgi:AcrR family transcriptional regulator